MTVTSTANGYPVWWKYFSYWVRYKRAKGRCECTGECASEKTHGNTRCVEMNGFKAVWAKGRVVLTVAHLNHNPSDCREKNVKAMCNRCHLRMDSIHHQENAKITRDKKRGQETFWKKGMWSHERERQLNRPKPI